MSQYFEQSALFDGILLLKEDEKRDPMKVVEQFFSDYRLHECRQMLWAMVETCLTSHNTEFSEPEGRADLLWRYRDIERILEAGTLLLEQHRQSDQGRRVVDGA